MGGEERYLRGGVRTGQRRAPTVASPAQRCIVIVCESRLRRCNRQKGGVWILDESILDVAANKLEDDSENGRYQCG